MAHYLDFEKPLEDLELKIEELRALSDGSDINLGAEIDKLEARADLLRSEIYSNLTRWQVTQIARHSERPYTNDYIKLMATDFLEQHGDRRFADDKAIVGGFGFIGGRSVMIIGHQKGRGIKARIERNFGQPHPEGYRKALRLMKLAERFGCPVLTLIDTPGAYPGIGAEERGQAEAIALNLQEMSVLRTPIVSVVIGEGGSGGALALGVCDRLLMLEHATYSVISPEGCASILWARDGALGPEYFAKAADALRLTARDLEGFGVASGVVLEPMGGAHRNPAVMADTLKRAVTEAFDELCALSLDDLVDQRYALIRKLGSFVENTPAPKAVKPVEDDPDAEDAEL